MCSGLNAGYTDTFNGSDQFPFRHEQCELVRVPCGSCLIAVADLWSLLWTRQDRERFYVSSATMVIKISRVHSPVVKAADCSSAGPWFNSGWKSCIAFMTWSDKLTNHTAQRNNIMSPLTSNTRKSVDIFPLFPFFPLVFLFSSLFSPFFPPFSPFFPLFFSFFSFFLFFLFFSPFFSSPFFPPFFFPFFFFRH